MDSGKEDEIEIHFEDDDDKKVLTKEVVQKSREPIIKKQRPHFANSSNHHINKNRQIRMVPRTVFQKVIDENLHFYLILPGMDKSLIKLKAKPSKIILDAKNSGMNSKIIGMQEISLNINLIEKIEPNTATAYYQDGILKITGKIKDLAVEIPINGK